MNQSSLTVLWANCVERLKDKVNNRSFWEALEKCRPITIESDYLILGMEAYDFNLASHLHQTVNMATIIQTVQEIFSKPLQLRIIEGVTPQDWETVKQRDARVSALKQAAVPRQLKQDTQEEGWEGLYEYIARLYMQTPLRSMPQGKARYVNDALYSLAEAMDTLYPENPAEHDERSLARILDRISNAADMPSTMLAFELERLRAWRKSEAETTTVE